MNINISQQKNKRRLDMEICFFSSNKCQKFMETRVLNWKPVEICFILKFCFRIAIYKLIEVRDFTTNVI